MISVTSVDAAINTNPPGQLAERRFDRRSWAMLAFAGFILLYSLALVVYIARLPTDGWAFQFNLAQPDPGYVFTEYYGTTPSPLQPGDVLVAVEGKPVARIFAEAFALQSPRPAHWQVGNMVDYTVERNGHQLALAVPIIRLPPQIFWTYILQQWGGGWLLLMSLSMMAIGFVVFWQRPRYLPAQLLLLFSWSLSSSQLVLTPITLAVLLYPPALFLAHPPLLFSIWQSTILPVLVHLLLVFPVQKQPLRRHPRVVLLAIYAPTQLASWLALALNLGDPAAITAVWGRVQAIQILPAFLVMLASVSHTFRTVHDATVRAQMRWVTFGVLVAFMGSVLVGLLMTLAGVSQDYFTLLIFPFLLLPLSLAVAILRYRLFDIGFLIHRTLIYGVVSALLAVIYVSSVVALQAVFRFLTGQTSSVAIALSTLVIAGMAMPLRNRIQTAIDRSFYRQKYDAQQTLERFVAGLQNQTDLAELAAGVRGVVQETLQPTGVEVWLVADLPSLVKPDEPSVPEELLRLTPDDPLVARLQHSRGVVEVERPAVHSPALQAMKEVGVVLLAPLVNQDALIGVITLGPRRSEQGYATDDRQLLTNLATQAAPAFQVAKLIRQQRQEAQQREQIEQELLVARSIQQTLLPQTQPTLPGWTIKTHYQPARAIGGDFYDFIPLPDGRFSLIIGDVTDKGVPAALVMAMTRTLLREMTKLHDTPGAILTAVNDRLVGDIPERMFVTCFYTILDPATGTLIYANAGHNLPYWRTEHEVKELHARGMPLGLLPTMSYEQKEMVMSTQDAVIFYTDGLVEAHDSERNMLGADKIKELIANQHRGPAIIRHLLDYQAAFTGPNQEQEDDTTLIVLQREKVRLPDEDRTLKIEGPPAQAWQTLTAFSLPSERGNERTAMQQVAAALAAHPLPAAKLERLQTAVAEATMNAIEHGNRNDPTKPVGLVVYANATQVAVHITDQGNGVPVPEPTMPDLAAKLAGLQTPRGWGLFLIQNMVDELNVRSTATGHTVELIMNR
ncbi:MAG: hypothetical protein DYG89_15035 [Caldilinea sp. CFX5]|nr:hypothetical protein [Caldilinea sp. CFX5]